MNTTNSVVYEKTSIFSIGRGVRTYGQMGSADPLPHEKMDEKFKGKDVQKRAVFYVYVIF